MCVCTVEDFSAEDKASGVKFCTVIHRLPRQGITHFGELCSPRSPKSDESASAQASGRGLCAGRFVERAATHRIGMCGYTDVPENGRTRCVVRRRNSKDRPNCGRLQVASNGTGVGKTA